MSDFFSALARYIDAAAHIRRFRLWLYLLVPGLISFIYFCIVLFLTIQYTPDIARGVLNLITAEGSGDSVWAVVIGIIIYMLVIVFFLLSFKHVTLAALSPILSHLSEVVEKRISGREPEPLTLKMFFSDLVRGVHINLLLLVRSLFFSVLAAFSALIPVAGMVISPLWLFLIQAYYAGFALGDYTLERKRLNVPESFAFARRYRPMITGVGTGFMLLLFIPLAGWFVAPTLGTIAATVEFMTKKEAAAD